MAMERSPVKDIEMKVLLRNALTDQINDREVYMKGIDASYNYEGYKTYRTSELKEQVPRKGLAEFRFPLSLDMHRTSLWF